MCEVLCYGEIGIDNIIQADGLPSPETAIFPTSDSYHGGGAAANTAVWLAALGLSVKLSGNVIGHDPYGELILERLQKHTQIDLSLVEQRDGVTTPFTRAIVTPDGERSFLIFWYPQAPKVQLTKEMLQGIKYLALDLYGGPERLETVGERFDLIKPRQCAGSAQVSNLQAPGRDAPAKAARQVEAAQQTVQQTRAERVARSGCVQGGHRGRLDGEAIALRIEGMHHLRTIGRDNNSFGDGL